MNKVFSPPKFCADHSLNSQQESSESALVVVDDILVFSKTAAKHKRHLDAVTSIWCQILIIIKASKCVWGQTEVPYLSHTICQNSVNPDPKKVQSVLQLTGHALHACVRSCSFWDGVASFQVHAGL